MESSNTVIAKQFKNKNSLDQNNQSLNTQIEELGLDIFQKASTQKAKSVFNKDWWYGKIMDWSMKNEQFKTQMFRFVDVLPSLNSTNEITRHIKEYFTDDKNTELPSIFNMGVGVGSLAPSLMTKAIKKNIEQMAKMFITGENTEQAMPVLIKKRKQKIAFTLDLLGEATLSEQEAYEYQQRYIQLITELSDQNWEAQTQLDSDDLTSIPVVNISVKLTSLYSQINLKAWEETKQTLKSRLRPILQEAVKRAVFINIDMESYDYKDLTLEVFKEILMEEEFKAYPHFGIVLQAYLRDCFEDALKMIEFAKARQCPFTIRLVKGAYWDYENILANQRQWDIPVFTNKFESDHQFEKVSYELLKAHPFIKLAIGSHNVRTIAAALAQAQALSLPKNALEIQMLYGMAEEIKLSLVNEGYRLREYATVGELIPGMAYLVRRLLENTSNQSFLRSKYSDHEDNKVLLQDPAAKMKITTGQLQQKPNLFYNQSLIDYKNLEQRQAFKQAMQSVKSQLPVVVPIHIDGKNIETNNLFTRENPSVPDQVVCQFHIADKKIADQAVNSAKLKFDEWRRTPASQRAEYLDKLADLMTERRNELAAIEVFEVGKPWAEADGDITEAIDFCRYYAGQMREISIGQKVGHALGEHSHYHYIPRGVSLVIAPWNFPLAILTGMVAASLVTGNTVVVKPAEQSTLTAYKLIEMLNDIGLPKGVVNFVPGYGEVIGEHLTGHQDISIIAFTGSKQVGLHILTKASQTLPGQSHVKKCVIEMGGKNALIIDNDADLDEAVHGVIYSAFAFQGQKCSACSRVIVLDEVYDKFKQRLLEACKSLHIGNPENPIPFIGPLVDKDAQEKVLEFIESSKSKNELLFQSQMPEQGHFVPITVFDQVSNQSDLAKTELFAPVLAIIKARNIDEAIQFANDSEYGLTAGLYSRSPQNIEKAKELLEAGNVYINRSITGAMVLRHPFGGIKMSGVGSKTGGPDYLKQFMDPRVVTENTMRRGFSPDVFSEDL